MRHVVGAQYVGWMIGKGDDHGLHATHGCMPAQFAEHEPMACMKAVEHADGSHIFACTGVHSGQIVG